MPMGMQFLLQVNISVICVQGRGDMLLLSAMKSLAVQFYYMEATYSATQLLSTRKAQLLLCSATEFRLYAMTSIHK